MKKEIDILCNKEKSHSLFVSLCLILQTSILYNLINNNISLSSTYFNHYIKLLKLSQMLKIWYYLSYCYYIILK